MALPDSPLAAGMQDPRQDESTFYPLVTSVLVAILAVLATWGALHAFIPASVAPDPAGIARKFIDVAEHFHPEPLERATYLAALGVAPVTLLGVLTWWRRHGAPGASMGRLLPVWQLQVAAALVCLTGIDYVATPMTVRHWRFVALHPGIWAASLLVVAWALGRHGRIPRVAIDAVVIALVGLVAASRVFDLGAVDENGGFWFSFNPVFDPVVQAHFGREPTVDFINQYGFYPVLLAPLFKLVGLGLPSFSLTMAALTFVSYALLYGALRWAVTRPLLLCLGFVALLDVQLMQFHDAFPLDFFFQYIPLRLLFPCLGVAALAVRFHLPAGSRRRWFDGVLYGVLALGVAWNVDAGLVAYGTWILGLVYRDAFEAARRGWAGAVLRHVARGVTGLVGAYAFLAVVMRLQFGAWPDFGRAIAYPSAFYGSGFFMLPMEGLHPWNLVALVYLVGLALALKRWVDDQPFDARHGLIFALAIMGCGLFSYYQGRSVIGNLIDAGWPAVMLAMLFTDDLATRLDGVRLAPATAGLYGLYALLLGAFTFGTLEAANDVGPFYRAAAGRWAQLGATGQNSVTRSIGIMRKWNVGPETLILSRHCGILYLYGGFGCPLPIPGMSELLFRADYNTLVDGLQRGVPRRVVLDGTMLFLPFNVADWDHMMEVLERNYRLIENDPEVRFAIYERKPPGR